MTLDARIRAGDLGFLDLEELGRFVFGQRWHPGEEAECCAVDVVAATPLRTDPPFLVHVIVDAATGTGPSSLYQVPLGFRPAGEGWTAGVVSERDGWTVYDALADPVLAATLVPAADAEFPSATGRLRSVAAEGASVPVSPEAVSATGADQTNTSAAVGDRAMLKLYRHLEAGPNPELELLAFLGAHGFENAPALLGWLVYEGDALDATAGVLVARVPAESDGWERVRGTLARGEGEEALPDLERLGDVIGRMHVTLASDPTDPSFAPEEPGPETLALLSARVDEEIESTFNDLPDTDALRPIADRGPEVVDRLRLLRQPGSIGRLIRTHGDLHLGQVLWTGEDWIVIDFEGEPRRPLVERRRKSSPLRDAAGMLRSLAYAAAASRLAGESPPEDWLERARSAFLDGYLRAVSPSGLLPVSGNAIEEVIRLHELEKAAYELRYELAHRPDWVDVPVAGILDLLQDPIVEA